MVWDQEALRGLYKKKVFNQELSLKEFSEKKLVVESRPSKVTLQLFDRKPMSLEIFERAAAALFENAYFVDLRGFDQARVGIKPRELVARLEEYPLINWCLLSSLGLPDPELWRQLTRQGFILCYWCNGLPDPIVLDNLEAIDEESRASGKSFVSMIVRVCPETVAQLPYLIDLASQRLIREIQFKTVRDHLYVPIHDRKAAGEMLSVSLDLALQKGIRLTINDQDLLSLVDPAKAWKASKVQFKYPQLAFPPPPELDPKFSMAHPWYHVDHTVDGMIKVAVRQNCFKPFHYVSISPEGKVATCNHMFSPAILEMGDLSESSFEEIWNGPKYLNFRSQLLSAQPLDPRCQWCFKHRMED